jgi:hypothetical protein
MVERNLDYIEEVYHFLSAAFHHSYIEVGMPDMTAHIEQQAPHLEAPMGMLMRADTVIARPRLPIDSDAVFQEN